MSSDLPAPTPEQMIQLEEMLLASTRKVGALAASLSEAVLACAAAEEARLLERRSTNAVGVETDRAVARARTRRMEALQDLDAAMSAETNLCAIHRDAFGRSG